MPNFRPKISEVQRNGLIKSDDIYNIIREVNASNNHASTTDLMFVGGTQGERQSQFSRDPDTVKVKNTTGSALTALRPVLGLDSPLLDPDETNREAFGLPIIEGSEPTESHAGKFAVLYGKTGDNDISDAVISGSTWVRVLVNDAGHEYAEIEAGNSTRLQTAESGTAKIIHLAADEESGGDDERWAFVRLSNGGGGSSGGDSSNSAGGNCDCTFIDVGTKGCLGGTNNAPTKLIVVDFGFLGQNIEHTWDSDCEYISDDIEHDCSGA